RPVRAPDLPGFGLSDKPQEPEQYSFPAIERTLGRYLDALRAPRVHLVCHDISGPPGAAWAAKHPERIASLTLLNTTLTLRGFRLPGLVAAGIALPWGFQNALLGDAACARFVWSYARRHAHSRPETFDGEDGEAFRRLFLRENGRRTATWTVKSYWGAPAYLAHARAALTGFSRPTLVLWGARDPFCTKDAASRLAALVPGSRLEFIEGASHFLPEDAPEEAARRLALFWERR
ncbi:alpha/beta fold hydrolase, partial [bacterium]